MNSSRVQAYLAAIPVGYAGFYLLGTAYYQGYLHIFGLDDSLFPLSDAKSLLSGFIALVSFGIVPITYALGVTVLFFLSILIAIVLSSTNRVRRWQAWLRERFRMRRRRNSTIPTSPSKLNEWAERLAILCMYIFGIFIISVSLIVISVLSTKSGEKQAVREIAEFRNQRGKYVKVYSGQLPKPTKARLIICSNSHCAFWLGGETMILKQKDIQRIEAVNPSFSRSLLNGHP